MISNKKLLITSCLISVVVMIVNYIGTFQLCGAKEYGNCMELLAGIILLLFPVLPLFVISLIIYFLRQEIYLSWFKFVRVWIPLSIFAIFLAPEYSHDWMYRVEKGSVALGMSAIFALVSIVIIVYSYLRLGKK